MRDDERLRRLNTLFQELRDKAREGWVIMVEGERDVIALRGLEVEGEIWPIGRRPKNELVDVAGRKRLDVIIMTDWDRRGNEIEKMLVKKLSTWGKIPDTIFKDKLRHLVGREISSLEEIGSFIASLEKRVWNKKERDQNDKAG
jgi:5S rRNA maturation endonuclease (ribonuclease M5)